MPDQSPRNHGGRREVVPPGLQIVRKDRKRQAHQAARHRQRGPCAGPDRGARVIGRPMDQDGDRKEQPHEIVLSGQRRGHRHQAEQDAELLGGRPWRHPRARRHHREESGPDQERYRQHDPVRGLETEIGQIHGARRLARIILIVVHRPRQPMRHRDDGLIDPGPVLLVALAKSLLRARPHHALVPRLQLRDVVLIAAKRRRQHEQEHAQEHHHARNGRPLPAPDQIGKHRHRENLDGGGQRKHASRHPRPAMLQQPEPEQHQGQQDKVRLSEIEHVEHKGDGDEARQREQPRARRPAGARHRVRELRRHPPRHRVEQRQDI